MDFDAIIVGAGPGGCLAARDLAREGLNVGLFDASSRDNLGKSVIVEAERASFDAVGLAAPKGDEVPYRTQGMRIFTHKGNEAFRFRREHPAVSLYLDQFSRRVLAEAELAGARFFSTYKAISPIVSNNKVQGVVFRESDRDREVTAPLVIDASGFNAALVGKLPSEMGFDFEQKASDIVLAENHFYEIDPDKAAKAVEKGAAGDEEVWARFAFAGSYSTEFSHLSLANRRAYILVGHKSEFDAPPIHDMISSFKDKRGYFGRRVHGGAGKICISHSLDRLVADGFMVIGEAARQVIPAHGSGVSSALYAGHMAARVAAAAIKKGDTSTAALWPYAREYQSGRGALLALFDISRLTIDSITPDQVGRMLESGITGPEDFYNVSIPKGISMSPGATFRRVTGMLKNRDMVGPIVKMAKGARAVEKHYKKYPKTCDPVEFKAWKERAKNLFAPFQA